MRAGNPVLPRGFAPLYFVPPRFSAEIGVVDHSSGHGTFTEEAIWYVCPHTPCSCARTHTDVVSCRQDSSRVGTASKRVRKSRRSGVNRFPAVFPTPSMSDAKKVLGFHAPPPLPQTPVRGLRTQRVRVRPTTVI